MRRVASSNEFFDILDKIGNGKFVTIGYVTGANLDVPKVSRKNPLTNRMKQYPDYTVFGNEQGEIGALVKITSYNMRYLNRTTVGQKYGEYKDSANVIRGNFGLDPIGSKQGYKQGTNWSPNGPEMYNGSNADLQGHSYNPQNIHGVKPKGVVYAVNKEGHIIKELTPEQVKPYLKAKREMDGVAALRKMGAEEERIQDYINQMNDLKFKYINFESNSILWIAATINGEKIVYINDNLSRAVDDINISPEDFREIARERYQIDLNNIHEMRMNRLKVLAEMDWRTYDAASEKAKELSQAPNISKYEAERRKNQADAFRKHSNDMCDKQYGVDKIKQRERDHDSDVVHGITKDKFVHTNGELKRLDRQSRDVRDYYNGKQSYRDGKWQNNESRNMKNKAIFRLTESELRGFIGESVRKILEGWNSNLSPDALDDKAYMDDLYAQRDKMFDDAWEDKNRRIRLKYPNKSQEWYDAMLDVFENKKGQKFIKEAFGKNGNGRIGGDIYGTKLPKGGSKFAKELMKQSQPQMNTEEGIDEGRPFKNNQGYSHFAVSKKSGKIINGWDYKCYDPSELRQFKKDYFDVDLAEYGFNPKDFRILTYKYLVRNGVNPDDNANWANNDEANAEFVG